jgi:fatty acid desaturase
MLTGSVLKDKLAKNEKLYLFIWENRRFGYFAFALYSMFAIIAIWFPFTIAIITTITWFFWLIWGIRVKHELVDTGHQS